MEEIGKSKENRSTNNNEKENFDWGVIMEKLVVY